MKKLLTIVLIVLVCMCCLTSCAQVEQEIGKKISVAAVEAVAAELDQKGVDYELADEQDLADLTAELKEELELELAGELTAGLEGHYQNPETGSWVDYLVIGFSVTADADAVEQVLLEKYDSLIKEGKAIVVNGGYIINVTVSSVVIEQGE